MTSTQLTPSERYQSNIVMMDAAGLTVAIRSRKVSCVEVMSAHLDHIERFNPKVNAIVALQDRGWLLAQAGERDAQLARGELIGPMHGFPHAVKDVAPVKGLRTTLGSPILKDFVPTADSIMVERLRKAGAIFIGKTLPITMSGCPALAMPAGFNDQGLPMGIQIAGPNHAELSCLQLGYAHDMATNWSIRRPPDMR